MSSLSASSFTIPSLIDPITLELIESPVCFEPCLHIVDETTLKYFPAPGGTCPCCRASIEKITQDTTLSWIIDLIKEINKCPKGSKEQVQLSYDLGRCILNPQTLSNSRFNKPVKLSPCGHVIEQSNAEKLQACPVLFCNTRIDSRRAEFRIGGLIEEVRQVVNAIQFDSRVQKKEIQVGHFDDDAYLIQLAEGIKNLEGVVETLRIEDSSKVTDAGLIAFIDMFSETIQDVHIVFSPKGLSKNIFQRLCTIELDNLCLIGSRSIVDDSIVDLISSMKLKSLNLQGCGVTNTCLSYLKKMTTLQSLALDKKTFNSEELAELQDSLAETRFYFI